MRQVGDYLSVPEQPAECATHGPYVSRKYLSVWTRCPKCAAAEVADLEAFTQRAAQAGRLIAWQRAVGDAGIPERFQDRMFDTYLAETSAQQNALRLAREYAEGFGAHGRVGANLMFLGRPGTGKTHLAAAIGMHLLRNGRSVLFSTVQRAIRRVRDTWTDGARTSESAAVDVLTTPDLLILDEVGIQVGSEFEKTMLFDMLNERYERRRSVLLLSNLSTAQMRDYLGERIYDRLREDGGRIVLFGWDSYRPVLGAMARATSENGAGE